MTDKMKKAGYVCLGIAALLSILMICGVDKINMIIIEHWTNTGLYLLFGNAIKRNIGSAVDKLGPLRES